MINKKDKGKEQALLCGDQKIERSKLIGTLALAGAIPAAVMLFVYICIGVWPFGSNSVLVLDLNGQYVYFFQQLHNIIYDGGSLLYTWERSLGGEFMGMYGYYLASPLSWLVALLPSSWIVEALLGLILAKVVLTGASMAYYLNEKRKTPRLNVVIFATLYALCAYSVNYLHNTMWMDALFLLPLVTLGIEKLVSERKFALFTLSLALTVISNYYIGYMVCLYVFVYFFYYHAAYHGQDGYNLKGERAHFIRSLLRMGLFSLIALAISAVVLLPSVYSLTFGKTTFTDPEISFKVKFDIIDFLFKLFPGATDTVRREGLPYIYCGTLTLFAFPCFLCSKKIAARRKIGACCILFFFFVVMSVSAFDLFFHGMQEPNWLNYRYSFIFSFLLVCFAYEGFENIGEFSSKFLLGVGAFLSIILILIQQKHYSDNFEYSELYWYDYDITVVYLGFVFLGLALAGIYFFKKAPATRSSAVTLCAIVLIEAVLSSGMHHATLAMDVGYSSRRSYLSFIERVSEITDEIKESDDSLYRMDKTFYRQPADDAALGLRGLSSTTSTMNKYTLEFLHRMGYNAGSYWSCFSGSNPVGDSLLGVKYIIDDDDSSGDYYKKLTSKTSTVYYTEEDGIFDEAHEVYTAAFLNENALPIAYRISSGAKDIDFSSYVTPFMLYNDLLRAMSGEEDASDVFRSLPIISTKTENLYSGSADSHRTYSKSGDASSEGAALIYIFKAETNAPTFMYLPTDHARDCKLMINGKDAGTIMANDTDSIVYLGCFEAGSENEVKITLDKKTSKIYIKPNVEYIWQFDDEAFDKAISALSKETLDIESFKENKIKGTIDVSEEDSLLFTSIPYDTGWVIRIDGEKVEPYSYKKTITDEESGEVIEETLGFADALIAVPIGKGHHTVSMTYMPKAFVIGASASAAGVIIFALFCAVPYIFKRKKLKKEDENND